MAKTDPSYPLFPICAFLGFVFALIPLPWHMQSWNSGTCFFMAWTALACLNQFVNSVVWAGNVLNPAPWWCEISIRIYLGASVGIPASSFCIVRRLYLISTLKPIATTRPEKRRAVFVDSLFCVLFPVIYIAMQYIVQGHRYNIFEDIGCYPAIYNTLLSYFISMMWPVVIGVASAVYCLLSLYHFNQRRTACASLLSGSPGLSVTRYFRLMALAATELCCTTPLGTFFIAINAAGGQVQPWISWAWVHYGYSRVSLYPAIIWRADKKNEAAMELSRWLAPFCAIVFFAYFGFAVEARRVYLKVWHRVRRYCCRVLKLKMSGVDREKGFVL
ncbi:pheromone receptor [Fistulina hepatica ATCC 64428]|uniref:Pheromone receptor n=1 Tax=Fistulina hepatica ATCC 64428 TaxID=1128425 RepID=A0A0D7ADY6_9AGAR|nr:pheromone receptor [Fistulina hepatica ATCC 64428]